jgi:hypothetical protein
LFDAANRGSSLLRAFAGCARHAFGAQFAEPASWEIVCCGLIYTFRKAWSRFRSYFLRSGFTAIHAFFPAHRSAQLKYSFPV